MILKIKYIFWTTFYIGGIFGTSLKSYYIYVQYIIYRGNVQKKTIKLVYLFNK